MCPPQIEMIYLGCHLKRKALLEKLTAVGEFIRVDPAPREVIRRIAFWASVSSGPPCRCAFFLLQEGQKSHLRIARWLDPTFSQDGVWLGEYFARHAGKRTGRQRVLDLAWRTSFVGVDLLARDLQPQCALNRAQFADFRTRDQG